MAATKQIILKIAADVAALKASLNQSRSHISAFAGQVKGMMATAFSIYTVVNFAKNLVNLQAEYSHTISFVNALTKATAEQKVQLDELNKRLGRDTPYTTTQAAEGMQILAQAGLSVDATLGTLPGVLELAQAGNMDLAKAADIATGAMYAYGKQASDVSHINDILVNTANASRQTVEDVGDAFNYASQFAHTANQSLDDISAMLLVLANHMVRGTSAGTGLSQTMATLVDPSEKAKKVLNNLNVQVFDKMTGKMRSLIDIFKQLKAANATPSEIAAIFTQRGTKVASVLVDFIDELEQATTTVAQWGTSAKTATERADNLWGDIKRLQAAWQALNYTIIGSQEGFLRSFVSGLTDAIKKIDNAITPIMKLKKAWDDLATTLGRPIDNVMKWLFGGGPQVPGVVGATNTAADFEATMKAAEWDYATMMARNKPLVRKGTWQETETAMLLRALKGELTEEEKLANAIQQAQFDAFKKRAEAWELEQKRVTAIKDSVIDLNAEIQSGAEDIINSDAFKGYFGPAVDTGELPYEQNYIDSANNIAAAFKESVKEQKLAMEELNDVIIQTGGSLAQFFEGFAGSFTKGQNAMAQMLDYIKKWAVQMIAKIAAVTIAAGIMNLLLGGGSFKAIFSGLFKGAFPSLSGLLGATSPVKLGMHSANGLKSFGWSGAPIGGTLKADVRGDVLQFALDENNRKQM